MTHDSDTVDCRGLSCPQPVLSTKTALEAATSPFVVLVDNEAACTNVTRFAESQGAQVTMKRQGDSYALTLRPGAAPPSGEEPVVTCDCAADLPKNLVAYVSSEGMGSGDEALGAVLMAAFLDTLAQWKGELSHVIFVNGGARLAVEGSPVLDHIRQLEEVGAEILVCGTCLRHFGVEDKLAVGSVSNMFAILQVLTKAGRILKP